MRGTLRYRNGAWRLQVSLGPDGAGRKRFKTATVKAPNTRKGREVADRALARMILDLADRRGAGGGEYTVSQWWDYACAVREGTIAGVSSLADDLAGVYLKKYLGDRWLHALTPTDFIGMYGKMSTEPGLRGVPLAPASVRRHHNSIRSVLELAVEDGVLERNPCERVAKKLPQIQEPTVRPADQDAVAKVLAVAARHPMELALVAVAATTGQRRGSIAALRWEDYEGGVLTFQRAWSRTRAGWMVRPTKSGSTVAFPLGPAVAEILDAWKERSASEHVDCGLELEWVFTREPGVFLKPSTMTKRWERLRAEAGCPAVTLKSLRPYFATSMLRAGVDLTTVQKLGGWAGPQILLRHYSGYADPVAAEAASRHAESTFGALSYPTATVTDSD